MSRELQLLNLVPQGILVWWGTWTLLAWPLQLKEIYSEYLGGKPLPRITNLLMQFADLLGNLKHSYDNIAVILTFTFLFIGIFIILSPAPDRIVASRSYLFQMIAILVLAFALLLSYVASIMPFITMLNEMNPYVSPTMSEKLWNAAPWMTGGIFLTILIFRYRNWRKTQGNK